MKQIYHTSHVEDFAAMSNQSQLVDKVVISRIYLCQITIIYLVAVIFTYERKKLMSQLVDKVETCQRVLCDCYAGPDYVTDQQ